LILMVEIFIYNHDDVYLKKDNNYTGLIHEPKLSIRPKKTLALVMYISICR
jgi:hypothetical protein